MRDLKLLHTFLWASLAFLSAGPAFAQSTVNPAAPAQNGPLSSAPVRSNFAATYSDVNGLLGGHPAANEGACVAGPLVFTDCLATGSTPYVWYKYSGAAYGYIQIGTINATTGVFAVSASAVALNQGQVLSGNAFNVGVGTATPTLGVAGASLGTLTFSGSTSGSVLVTPQVAAGSPTLTLPNTTGTFAVGATTPIVLNATTGNLTCPSCVSTSVANTFTAAQTVNLNATSLPTADTGTLLQAGSTDGTGSRIELTTATSGGSVGSTFTGRAANGTIASPTALTAGNILVALTGHGYYASAWSSTSAGGVYLYADGTWSSSSWPTKLCLDTAVSGSTTRVDALCVNNAGGVIVGSPTGSYQGAGTINATGVFVNGTAVATGANVSSFSGGTTGFTPSSPTTGAIVLSGTLGTANGGTNCSIASITCFNNITGFTAAGTTGTTSTNLVFSTSPTLVTPTLGVATATSLNGLTVTSGTGTLTIANAKTLTDTSGIGADLLLGATGGGFAAYGGASCTNQFITAISATGAGTCASVVNADLTAGTFTNITGTGTLTAGATGSGFTVALGSSTITGQLAIANGGTNANLTANAGGVVYSTSSALAILNNPNSNSECLLSGTSAPTWGSCSGSTGVASLGNASADTSLTIAGTGSGPWTGTVTAALNLGNTNTWTGPQTMSGSSGYWGCSGNNGSPSFSNGVGSVQCAAVDGLILRGQGSAYDIDIHNSGNTRVAAVPTGTQNFQILGSLLLASTTSFVVNSNTMTFPGSAATLASLNLTDQTLSGGANVTAYQDTISGSALTVDCGKGPLQYVFNTGAFTLTAPTSDGSCVLEVINASGSSSNPNGGAITLSNFSPKSPAGVTFANTLTQSAVSCTVTSASPGVITWTGHGLTANAPIYLTGTTAPTGLTKDVVYYVVGSAITTNTIEISATPGGAAINTSSTGTSVTCNEPSVYDLSLTSINNQVLGVWAQVQ